MADMYAVPKEKLTDIADAIRLKRDITDEMTLDDMPMHIGLIEGNTSDEGYVFERNISVNEVYVGSATQKIFGDAILSKDCQTFLRKIFEREECIFALFILEMIHCDPYGDEYDKYFKRSICMASSVHVINDKVNYYDIYSNSRFIEYTDGTTLRNNADSGRFNVNTSSVGLINTTIRFDNCNSGDIIIRFKYVGCIK